LRLFLQHLCALVVISSVPLAGANDAYPIIKSKLVFGGGNLGRYEPIYWLDNERVLFGGYETSGPAQSTGKLVLGKPGLYEWNTRTGAHARHADLQDPIWTLCFRDGFVFYSVSGDHTGKYKVVRAGPLGKERQLDESVPWKDHPELDQCRPYPREELRPESKFWKLRPGDGHVTAGGVRTGWGEKIHSGNQNEPVTLHREHASAVELPILAKEMSYSAKFTYSEYAKRYVLIPHTWRAKDLGKLGGSWPKGQPVPVYLIGPDGETTVVSVPAEQGRPMGAFPTRAGLFWISNNAPSGHSSQAGGWILKDGQRIKLFAHLVNGAGVSPDGCRIAYASDPRARGEAPWVSAINLCGEGR